MPAMISGPQPAAVEAGARVLMRGGNAYDAAITCAFVQGIVDPQMCGIGGYAMLTAWDAARGVLGYDGQCTAGSRAREDMWADRVIGLSPDGWGYFLQGQVNDAGYTSICTPGWVKLIGEVAAQHATLPWAELIAPAIEMAERGFWVGEKLAKDWRTPATYPQGLGLADYVQRNAEASRIYLKPEGVLPDVGDIVRNPDYARTLRRLADAGPDDFYRGALAREISADLDARGSFVTADDLARYAIEHKPPTMGSYRGHAVHAGAAPHGGPTVIAILNILEGWDLRAMRHNSADYIYKVGMAMKAAFADRNAHMADPRFNAVPIDWMISKQRAAEWRAHIDAGLPVSASSVPTGQPNTTHVTVVDHNGTCVSLTHSLGSSSGVVTPGLGFMYNNSMVNFEPLPGRANSIAPGKGRTTGMAPTVVLGPNGRPRLVLGAPGASRIIAGVLQVIVNVLDFGMSAGEAVLAPRFDCQVGPIRCQRRIPGYILDQVRTRHPIDHLPMSHGGIGRVHAIAIDPISGALSGGADTGADGMALEVA
jgi:gamma-glutamyltranspeptidase / glutathione hydrolase